MIVLEQLMRRDSLSPHFREHYCDFKSSAWEEALDEVFVRVYYFNRLQAHAVLTLTHT
jgi:hypothetical protein